MPRETFSYSTYIAPRQARVPTRTNDAKQLQAMEQSHWGSRTPYVAEHIAVENSAERIQSAVGYSAVLKFGIPPVDITLAFSALTGDTWVNVANSTYCSNASNDCATFGYCKLDMQAV